MIVPSDTRSGRFFRFTLPVLAAINLLLGTGLLVLESEVPHWERVVASLTGGFCFMVAGWLLASGWSKAYWSRTIQYQVRHWSRVADVFFRWLEEAPVPLESLRKLRGSLEDIAD